MKRTKLFACLMGVLGFVGCHSEKGTVLEIANTPAFEDDCTVNSAPTKFQGQGFYDPSGGAGYILNLTIVNQANDQENPAAITGDSNIKPSANDVQLVGFDYCFYSPTDEGKTAYDPKGKGLLVDCDDLPDSQRAFVPRGGGVSSGGGTLVGSFTTIDIASLQSVFGASFNPTAIPVGDNPLSNTRSAGWGTFPNDFSTVITVNVRVRALDQVGRTVRSNWYGFPVIVAPTAVRDACQAAIAPCGDGTNALQGTAFPAGTCGAIFSGASFTCEAINQCA